MNTMEKISELRREIQNLALNGPKFLFFIIQFDTYGEDAKLIRKEVNCISPEYEENEQDLSKLEVGEAKTLSNYCHVVRIK